MGLNIFYCSKCEMTWGLDDVKSSEFSREAREKWICPDCNQPERLNEKTAKAETIV